MTNCVMVRSAAWNRQASSVPAWTSSRYHSLEPPSFLCPNMEPTNSPHGTLEPQSSQHLSQELPSSQRLSLTRLPSFLHPILETPSSLRFNLLLLIFIGIGQGSPSSLSPSLKPRTPSNI